MRLAEARGSLTRIAFRCSLLWEAHILGTLEKDEAALAAARRIYEAISGIRDAEFKDGTTITVGPALLAVNDPEKYRAQILGLLSGSIAEIKKAFGRAISVEVDGLENPVAAMQVRGKEVVLFINYKLNVKSNGK